MENSKASSALTGRRVSVADGAPMLGVSPHTLRSWLRQRRIPYYRCGRRVVVDVADLEKFLSQNRIEPSQRRDR